MVLYEAGEAGRVQILLHTVGHDKLIFISNHRQKESVVFCRIALS